MSANKILSISIIFVSAILLSSNCHAYDSEGGLEENETFHADYGLWMGGYDDDYTFLLHTQAPDGTYVYRPSDPHIQALGVFSWTAWVINCYINRNSDIQIWTSWELQGKTYNEDTEIYEDKGTQFVKGYMFEVAGGSSQSKSCTVNVVQDYFTNVTPSATGFEGYNEGGEHPDYIEIKMSVGNGLEDIEYNETIGITMSSEQAEAMVAGGSGETDYGFGSGSGGEGGVGDIYSSVGGGIGDGDSGIQPVFQILFYCLIPLIFILSVMKMIGRLSDV